MDDRRGLQRVIRALSPHPCSGDPPKLGVENLNEPTGGLVVAIAKARHQPGYGIRLKTG